MLVRSLKELQQDGLVERTSYPEVPPRVEYALTERGASLTPVLSRLAAWGIQHLAGPSAENSPAAP
jgi:DNA-binding HxlR family transcriptional regulator